MKCARFIILFIILIQSKCVFGNVHRSNSAENPSDLNDNLIPPWVETPKTKVKYDLPNPPKPMPVPPTNENVKHIINSPYIHGIYFIQFL